MGHLGHLGPDDADRRIVGSQVAQVSQSIILVGFRVPRTVRTTSPNRLRLWQRSQNRLVLDYPLALPGFGQCSSAELLPALVERRQDESPRS